MHTQERTNINQHDPLRVLMVSARYLPIIGGVETHVAEVAPRLAQSGVEVTVLTTDASGDLPADEVIDGVRIRRVPAWPNMDDYYFSRHVYSEIRRGEWDLVHCQGYHTGIPPVAMLASLQARTPYLLTLHSGGHSSRLRNTFRGVQLATIKPLLRRAERLIAVSAFEARHFQERLGLSPEKFTVVPNGAPSFDKAPEAACKAGDTLLLSIGRLEHYKGHHRVIKAMPALLEHYPEARLRIAGSGPYEAELRGLAERLGIADRVEIRPVPAGDRQGMAELLRQASLVTLLSDYESQGIAVLEALALGRRVVVADTSALSEFAEQGLARAVDPHSTPAEIAATIAEELQSGPLRQQLNLPTWDDCANRLLDIYQAVTGTAQVPASPHASSGQNQHALVTPDYNHG